MNLRLPCHAVNLYLAKIRCCFGSLWRGHKLCTCLQLKEVTNYLERGLGLCSLSSEVYESLIEHAEQLLSPLVFNCLPLALSLHSLSPSVAMYQQVCCLFQLHSVVLVTRVIDSWRRRDGGR